MDLQVWWIKGGGGGGGDYRGFTVYYLLLREKYVDCGLSYICSL